MQRKWLVVCPAIIWFGYYAATLEAFPGIDASYDLVTKIFGGVLLLYVLTWTPMIRVFTYFGIGLYMRMPRIPSEEEKGCVANVLRFVLICALYGLPLFIFQS